MIIDKNTPFLIYRASEFAINAHESIKQVRKYNNEPYWKHCDRVASMVSSVGGSLEQVASAWLHDTVEDTPITLEDIKREFGEKVASLVEQLTDVSKKEDGNRAKRRAIDLEHTKLATPEAQTVKLADIIDNVRSIVPYDKGFAWIYLPEKVAQIDVLKQGNQVLLQLAQEVIAHNLFKLEVHSKMKTTQEFIEGIAGQLMGKISNI